MFQSVGVSVGWRKHQLLADVDENESPVPDKFKKRPSSSSLNTIRMSLRKRMPLKQVELNLHENPTWESLEAKEKQQTFRAITRTARNAFGTVSQVPTLATEYGWEGSPYLLSSCFNTARSVPLPKSTEGFVTENTTVSHQWQMFFLP